MSKIMEDVVGEVIAKEVGGVIGMVVSRINYEIKLAWGFREELEGLKEQFTRMSWLLEGASGEPITNPLMGDWLKKIKDVANDANNLIDEWSFDVLEKQVINSSGRKRDKFKTTVTYPFSRFRTSHKVVELRKLISSIYNDANELGIKPIKVAAGDAYSGVKQTLEIQNQQRNLWYQRQCIDDELVGRDEDRKKLVKLICDPTTNNNTSLNVVGIVGLAGLGKTALSKQVSKATEVSAYFDSLVIWLIVSHDFDLIYCLNRMVEILFGENLNLRDRNALIKKLQLKLKEKKYLLILDDVWDTTFWEPLRMTLNDIGGANGSTILVTSRDRSAIQNMKTYSYGGEGTRAHGKKALIHQLQGLNECDSWSLFMARFNCDDDDEVARSEDEILLARKMVKSCKGVPLAIKALGDLLHESSEEWQKIEASEVWKEKDKSDILPSLRLSYDYLPNEALKKCFAFCAIFKEDDVISKDKLIYMWMAHGLLQPCDDEIMERTGEKYCKVLLNRSLFQEAIMDKYGNVKTFKMHDLVTSLARVVSKGECLHSSNGEYDGSTEVVVQHLSLFHFKRKLTESCCMKLQTLFHEDELDVTTVRQLKECKRLRVLRIGGFLNEDSMLEFLLGSSSFKHLRYLEVDSTYIENISAGGFENQQNIKLYHLQTLWIRYNFGDDSLAFIKVLLMSDLVNLRHIHCGDPIGIPKGLGRLTTLQTLSEIDLKKKWGGRISELGSLKNLRGTLTLKNVSHISSDYILFSAGDNCHIENLHLSYCDFDHISDLPRDISLEQQERVLEAMRPHSNLKRLDIWGYGGLFPTWLTKAGSPLCSLVSLTLVNHDAEGYLQMENFSCLRLLTIIGCRKLRLSFPKHGFHCCKLLEQLNVKVSSKVCLPDLSPLTKLRVLRHFNLSEAEGHDHELVGLGNLACLRELETTYLLPADLDEHSPLCNSLQKLTLWCPPSDFHAEQLPMQLQHLKTLQCLIICNYNVKTLPEWLGNLTALRQLEFQAFKNLKWLPSKKAMQRLSNLHTFSILRCPILKKDILNKSGEWLKIAHIPNIEVH